MMAVFPPPCGLRPGWNGITVPVESYNLQTKIARHRKAATVAYVMGDADKVLQAADDDTATEVQAAIRFIDIGDHYDQNWQNNYKAID